MRLQQLTIHTEDVGGSFVVRPVGVLDVATGPAFRDTLLGLLDEQRGPVVVDLSRVTFMDSTGLAAIVAGHERAHQGGQYLSVAALTPPIARIFRLTSVDTVIPIRPDG